MNSKSSILYRPIKDSARDTLEELLYPRVYQDVLQYLTKNLPIRYERNACVVAYLGSDALTDFTLMSSSISTSEECTISERVIYTNDDDFNVDDLIIYDNSYFTSIKKGDYIILDSELVYLFKLTTKAKTHKNILTEYLVYLPCSALQG